MKTAHLQRSVGRGLDGSLRGLPRVARAKPALGAGNRLASGTVLIGREMQELEKQEAAAICTRGGVSDGA